MEIKSTKKDDFCKMYDSTYTLLMSVAMHLVYNTEIAEDLVQDTFERFYVKNITFPSEEDAKYWLLRVVKNLSLNHLRRNKRDSSLVKKMTSSPLHESVNFSDSAKETEKEEEKKAVREAVESLPESFRLVIKLKEYSGLDYKSIGKVLGISETNVKVRVHRARKKLEEILASEDWDVY